MANTEGMTDETMAELLTPTTTDGARLQRRQQRLDMPMGERPAATIIRRSNNNNRSNIVPETVVEEEPPKAIPPPVMMGGVVERPVKRGGAMDDDAPKKGKSLFSQRRIKPQAGGFPSIHNKPLGTFARKKKKGTTSPPSLKPTQQSGSQDDSSKEQTGIHRDSQAMLAQMSHDEIQDNIAELQAAMSPEMIAFMQKRSQQKKNTKASASTPPAKPKVATNPAVIVNEVQEKERLAQVMSSIRTYDDMDTAYTKELGTPSPQDNLDDGLEGKSEWDQACSLLRSTAPRQTLWAARVVCLHLEEQVQVQGDKLSIGNDWPFPSLLPVSLRCLLDASVTHTNGLEMHTYILRSFYALLRLRAPSDHVVDVTLKQESSQVMYERFNDAVPTPAFGSLYPSMAATPVVKDGNTAVAYATASSSTSAQQDGDAFLKDPMWTLLTKMRIVPRIAELLQSQHDLSEEGLIAMSGILAMLSIRSPGAASAISSHETLLKTFLKKTVMPPIGDGEESHFLKPNVMLPVMILLNNMARQSRVVASKLPYIEILPPLLAMGDDDDELTQVQQWALILWRKLLRYGLGLSGLSSLVSLSIKHLGEASVLAPEYCSLFAACLDCVRVYRSKGSNSRLQTTLSANDVENLKSVVSWLSPSVRQCIETLHLGSELVLASSKLRLLTSFAAATSISAEGDDEEESLNLLGELPLLQRLSDMMEADEFKEIVGRVPFGHVSTQKPAQEASLCCFMSSLLSLVSTMEADERFADNSELQSITGRLRSMLREAILLAASTARAEKPNDRCRSAWIKQCHFSIAKSLLSAKDASTVEQQRPVIRLFVIDLIGRMGLGDEAKAAILLSDESLFQSGNDATSASTLSSMFMRELCTSDANRKQLDHSFKLQRGFGVTSDGWGPFATESLLSDADRGPSSEAGLLPIGTTWLWQILAGSLGADAASPEVANEGTTIITSCLDLLIQMEEESQQTGWGDAVPTGAKVYFLLNIFLYPESILGDPNLRSKACVLLGMCTRSLGQSFALEFTLTALDHSQVKQPNTDETANKKDEKLLAVLTGIPDVSSKAMRVATGFCVDLCTAYIEFGAQYEEFTRAIRVLLRPQFPSKIRCVVLGRLREVSHLLGLEEEVTDPSTLMQAVEELLPEQLPPKGERDAPELLDLLTDISKGRHQGRLDDFFSLVVTATLSRALLGALQSKSGLEAIKRRLLALPQADIVLTTCSSATSRSSLVRATIEASVNGVTQGVSESTLNAWIESHSS